MPELPEVETVRRGIERLVVGNTIQHVEILVPKLLKPPITNPEEFVKNMIGCTFTNARRRGKHLIFGMDNGYALYAHLNMRGQMVVALNFSLPRAKYLCAIFRFDSEIELRYHDMWTWGELRLIPDRPEDLVKFVPALATMGVEPLSDQFTGQVLAEGARAKPGSPIKAVLLDQAVAAGLGNIYADEALFRAGISPLRKVRSLTDAEWVALAGQISTVIDEAVDAGGTYSSNYVDVEGRVGSYHPRVYGRATKPCFKCETPLTGSRLGGRSTVFCPKCQQ